MFWMKSENIRVIRPFDSKTPLELKNSYKRVAVIPSGDGIMVTIIGAEDSSISRDYAVEFSKYIKANKWDRLPFEQICKNLEGDINKTLEGFREASSDLSLDLEIKMIKFLPNTAIHSKIEKKLP